MSLWEVNIARCLGEITQVIRDKDVAQLLNSGAFLFSRSEKGRLGWKNEKLHPVTVKF